ncbi:MAG: lipoyl(octanoyl) transferase LipB [Polaromonas sp.]
MTLDVRQLGRVDYLPTFAAMQAFTASRTPKTVQNTPQISLEANEYGCNQLWICEHPAVYTQGLAGKAEHIFNADSIPVVQTDRGGQVTFHGPGQVVAYPLMDLKAAGYYVKEYVYRVEEAVIRTLAHFGVTGHRVRGAPGIYVRLDDPFSHARLVQKESVIAGLTRNPDALRDTNTAWIPDQVRDDKSNADPAFGGLGKIAALGIKVSRNCTYHGVALNVAMDLEPFTRINPCGYTGLQTVDLRTIGVSVDWQDAANVLSQKLVSYLAP